MAEDGRWTILEKIQNVTILEEEQEEEDACTCSVQD
jgi:hypothetical protein